MYVGCLSGDVHLHHYVCRMAISEQGDLLSGHSNFVPVMHSLLFLNVVQALVQLFCTDIEPLQFDFPFFLYRFIRFFPHRWVCLKMLCTPLNPMVLLIIIPMKNGYFIGNINPTFSDKPRCFYSKLNLQHADRSFRIDFALSICRFPPDLPGSEGKQSHNYNELRKDPPFFIWENPLFQLGNFQ